MRYRSHVLHSLLEGFVLRKGHEILKSTLPPKVEHVLYLRPSKVQADLYDFNMSAIAQAAGNSNSAGPLKAFAVCSKVREREFVSTCICVCVHTHLHYATNNNHEAQLHVGTQGCVNFLRSLICNLVSMAVYHLNLCLCLHYVTFTCSCMGLGHWRCVILNFLMLN